MEDVEEKKYQLSISCYNAKQQAKHDFAGTLS